MKRHLVRHVVRSKNWPKMSDEFNEFIESDGYACGLWRMMQSNADIAADWYDADGKPDVTRWVPEHGGGDAYLIFPGDMAAHICLGIYDSLYTYMRHMDQFKLVNELERKKIEFFWAATSGDKN